MKNVGLLFGLCFGSTVTAQTVSMTSNVPAVVNLQDSFLVEAWENSACSGKRFEHIVVNDGTVPKCFNTAGKASLSVANQGSCPNGHVQISYWEEADCRAGKRAGDDDYMSRNTCRQIPSDGRRIRSVSLQCQTPEAVEHNGVQHSRRQDCQDDEDCDWEDLEATLNILNRLDRRQTVYIVGRGKSKKRAFVKQDGSIVEFTRGFDFASVAIGIDPKRQVSLKIARPFTECRLYAADRNPGWTTYGQGIGWPQECPSTKNGRKCNFMEFQIHDEDTMNTLSAGASFDGLPEFDVKLRNSGGETQDGGIMRWGKTMTVTLRDGHRKTTSIDFD
ncbi:hypothetical protein CDD83_5070 [Cordyceps sp. RAO-2017]|nr:hypothetical protein CDD83_5070 [Cordyceps sp. RAO-2017]